MIAAGLVSPRPAAPEVVRVEIDRRELILGGRAWGEAGAYEKLVGRVYFSFDPANPANAAIVDLGFAPHNGDGRIEAWAEFMVLQPADPARRRGVAWLEVSNRGGKASLRYFNRALRGALDPTRAEHFGDGLLFREGLTVIWVGWQWDVPDGEGLVRLHVPVARGPGGTPITGLVRSDWVVDEPVDVLPLAHRGHRTYPPADPTDSANVLTVRVGREGERRVVPRERWHFVARAEGIEMGRLTAVALEGGFEPGHIYELVYRAEDPRLVGLGLAVVRDMISYAKYDLDSEFPVHYGIAFGVSQTGRFLRHFLYQGFNVDEGGRTAFDGMLVHTAGAGRGSFNHRFAQPSRDAHRYSAFFYPTDLFPFTSRSERDPVTGMEDGLAADPDRRAHWPKVFYTNTGYEYWGRAAALIHTSPDGRSDVEPLEGERIYHLASGQHFVGPFPPRESPLGDDGAEFAATGREQADAGPPVFVGNPLDFLLTLRALAVRLVAWVADDEAPPPSRYPRLDRGELVPVEGLAFPRVPGVRVPRVAHVAYRADYGPRFRSEGIVDVQPPSLGPHFPVRVPQVDGLGNEMTGARSLELRVPVATYTPWSLRERPPTDELRDFVGLYVPLPFDAAQRARWHDPRPSLRELYGGLRGYMDAARRAASTLVDEGLLLPEDVEGALAAAEARWMWADQRRNR